MPSKQDRARQYLKFVLDGTLKRVCTSNPCPVTPDTKELVHKIIVTELLLEIKKHFILVVKPQVMDEANSVLEDALRHSA